MAQTQHQDSSSIGFKTFQLLKDQTLGVGSYGIVCKALCDDLLCAAKIIHQTLVDANARKQVERQKEHRLPISRFMQECEFMSAIRHPNIVQYMGTCQDSETKLPVLLMELMDDSLTNYLESSPDAIPYHIQVNFTHDIILAISYLHLNKITHRDLSSNNVLLRGNVQAKITDFGMAKLGGNHFQATRVSATMCPGTDVYMPPEAVDDKPVYTQKIDCFSIGVLIIQMLTQIFPDPGSRHKLVHTTDPRFPTINARVLEIERRQNQINLVDPNHAMLPIALDCLKDNDVERPTAQELCHRVGSLKQTPQFSKSVSKAQDKFQQRKMTELEREIRELRQIIQDKDEENHRQKTEHTQQIRGLQQIIGSQNKRVQEIIREKDQVIAARQQECQQLREVITQKNQQLQQFSQQLRSSQQIAPHFQTQKHELEQPRRSQTEFLTAISPQLPKRSYSEVPQNYHRKISPISFREEPGRGFTLNWEQAKKAPVKIHRYKERNAVVQGNTVYFRPWVYDTRVGSWSQALDLATQNHIQLLNERSPSAAAVVTGEAVIFAGGVGDNKKMIKTVEIMDRNTREWSSAADLPQPVSHAEIAIVNDQVYLIGGVDDSGATSSVYKCSLIDLLYSCQSQSLAERLARSLSLTRTHTASTWTKVASLPVVRSTCITVQGRLLAIGGCDPVSSAPTSAFHIYEPTTNRWEVISNMNMRRSYCFAAVLPRNKLMVVGGYTNTHEATDSIEIATVYMG